MKILCSIAGHSWRKLVDHDDGYTKSVLESCSRCPRMQSSMIYLDPENYLKTIAYTYDSEEKIPKPTSKDASDQVR